MNSQATLRALEPTECLFIKKDTFELAVGKLSSILEKDKIRKSRNDRISAARNAATVSYRLYGEICFRTQEQFVRVEIKFRYV